MNKQTIATLLKQAYDEGFYGVEGTGSPTNSCEDAWSGSFIKEIHDELLVEYEEEQKVG